MRGCLVSRPPDANERPAFPLTRRWRGSGALPARALGEAQRAAITFAFMRIAFWIGYRIHPLYRAFGFAGTAYLNFGLLGAALWLSVT